jgi:hypothetical protein
MKTLCFLSLVLSLVFVSCSKDGSSPQGGTNSITATINGKTQTFNNILLASNTEVAAGAYQLALSASDGTTATSNVFSLTLSGFIPIAPGEYPLTTAGDPKLEPGMGYQINGATSVYIQDLAEKAITIKVATISSTNITGTFSGKLTLFNGTGDATQVVTDGKFNVNFK